MATVSPQDVQTATRTSGTATAGRSSLTVRRSNRVPTSRLHRSQTARDRSPSFQSFIVLPPPASVRVTTFMNADKYGGVGPVRVFAEEVRLDVPLLALPHGPEDVDRDGRFGVMRGAIVLVAAAPLEEGDDLIRRDLARVEEILPVDDLADF